MDEHDKFYLKLQSEKLKIQFNKSIEMKLKEEVENESTLVKILGKIKQAVVSLYNKIGSLLKNQKPKQIEFKELKLELSPNELEEATNQVLPQIESHIKNLLSRNPKVKLDKCVLVGGSSNNVFLHAKIRDIVNVETVSFSEEERYMAISYGASLVAAGQVQIREKTHFNYGILVKLKGNIEKLVILPQGTEYGKRIETKETLKALSGTTGKTSIVIWRSDEEYLLDKEFGSIQNTSEVKYAMQIDENGMLVVECIANDGKVLHAKNIFAVHEKITRQELEKLIQPYTEIEIKNSPDKSQLISQLEVNLQRKKVLLYNGDITWLTVDVIVSSANSYRTMSTGVSLAIKNRGGEEILQEYQKLPMNKTKVLVTNAGKLHAKKVFHAIIDDEGKITPVAELTRNCL